MAKFKYVGETQRVYPDIIIPGKGSLVANPGDEVELPKAPTALYWVELPATAPDIPTTNTARAATPSTEV